MQRPFVSLSNFNTLIYLPNYLLIKRQLVTPLGTNYESATFLFSLVDLLWKVDTSTYGAIKQATSRKYFFDLLLK